MKKGKLKVLAAALVAGAALLLAGCGQQTQQTQQPPQGGQEPPKPIQPVIELTQGGTYGGIVYFSVSYNENSQVQSIEVYVDGKLLGKQEITTSSAGVKPQALWPSFTLNTLACTEAYIGTDSGTGCSPSDNTPVFLNGKHTVKAVLKNAVETKSVSVDVYFQNDDRLLSDLSGNSATDAGGFTWYGGDDLTLKLIPVSYSGKPVSKIWVYGRGRSVPRTYICGANTGVDLGAGAGRAVEVPVSGGSASVTISKTLNSGLTGGVQFSAGLKYDDGTYSSTLSIADYALDFYAPTVVDYRMKLNGVYDATVNSIATATSNWFNGDSPLYVKANEVASRWCSGQQGVGGVSYQIQVLDSSSNVVATLNPGDTLAGVPEAPTGSYDLQVVNLKDALGNTQTAPIASAFGGATFGVDKTPPSLASTFAADGKTLNGTLGLASALTGTLTESGSGVGSAANDVSAALPSSTSAGGAGWLIEATFGGCTYTLDTLAAANTNLPTTSGSYTLDMTELSASATPAGCTSAYSAPTASSGDGNYTVTIRAVDQARNVSDPVTVSFYWLTTPPTLTFNSPLPATVTLGGSPYFDANASISVSSPVSIYKAVLYASPGTATYSAPTDVQVIAPAPSVDVANGAALAWASGGTITGNFKDFTSLATSGFSFTARFNSSGAGGTWNVVATAVPEAYDNTGVINVTNLDNQTSQTVRVNP